VTDDPATRAWLLTEAFAFTRRTYRWAVGELAGERQHVPDARRDRERLLGNIQHRIAVLDEITNVDRGAERRQVRGYPRGAHDVAPRPEPA
jgi:hypothetical protein